MSFFETMIRRLVEDGHSVDLACSETESTNLVFYRNLGCKIYPLSCARAVTDPGNLRAIGQIGKLVKQKHYDIVHVHTPIAAACARIACRKVRKTGTKVFYTAHGFHFFKGAPLINWLLFYPVEWLCSFWTDVQITINQEDFARAKKLHAKCVEYVPGVGVDVGKFTTGKVSKREKREELGIPEEAFVLMSAGELNTNKNHQVIIRAIAACKHSKMHYLIAGKGKQASVLKRLAQDLQVAERVHILGYRMDVDELLQSADVYVHPSFREGLPLAIMEAMASGLPCVVSDIRGNSELIDAQVKGGYRCDPKNVKGFAAAIQSLFQSEETRQRMGSRNAKFVEQFSQIIVLEKMCDIYYG